MRKSAFNATELLLVFLIGALIAYLVLRVVYKEGFANPEEKKIQKAGYQLEQVVSQMYDDDSLYPKNSTYTKRGFKNTDDVVVNGIHYSGDEKFCRLLAGHFKKNSERVSCTTEGDYSNLSFETNDGVYWYVPRTDFSKGYTTVFIDINGENLGFSNRTNACTYDENDCPNPDLFKFFVRANGTVIASIDNKVMPETPSNDTSTPYSIKIDVSCSDNTTNCGTVSGASKTISHPGGTISGLSAGTYTFTASPADSYYSNWTSRSVVIDGSKLNTNIKVVFAPIKKYCLNVNVNYCDKSSPSGCAVFKVNENNMSQKTVNGIDYSTMQYCNLTPGTYTLTVTPNANYTLDPVPTDENDVALSSLTQNIKIGTEDVTLTVNVVPQN